VGDPLRADTLFQEAITLLDQGRWQEACPKFRESLAAEASVGTLLNVASCSVREGNRRQAAREYRRVLELNAATDDPERKRSVAATARAALAKLESQLSRVIVRVTPPDAAARITIDGLGGLGGGADLVRAGEPTELEPGKHAIAVDAPGFRPARRDVVLAAGARDVIVFDLARADAPGSAPPTPAPASSRARPLATAGWVTGLGGSALLATGAALVAVAADRASAIRAECGPDAAPPACPLGSAEVADDLASEGRAYQISGFAALGVGGAALGTGVALLIADAVSPTESVAALPRVSNNEVGLWVAGTF